MAAGTMGGDSTPRGWKAIRGVGNAQCPIQEPPWIAGSTEPVVMSTKTLVIKGGRALWRCARALLGSRAHGARPAPWHSTLREDLRDNRPWNIAFKAARELALLRVPFLSDGTTVVIVNWNTLPMLREVIDRVKLLGEPKTRILIVDNGSTDGSREWLRTQHDLQRLLLPVNVGHALGLDFAMCRVRTKVALTLDSDAFPLRKGWMLPALDPVREGRAVLAGLRSSRNFVHPVYLAMNTAAFLRRRLSFQLHYLPTAFAEEKRWGENAWDTGELMTQRLRPSEVSFVERGPNLASGLPGMTVADVVYHHGGVTRLSGGFGPIEEIVITDWRAALESLDISSKACG